MTGDASFSLAALFDEPIKQRQRGASGACHYFLEDAHRDGSFRLRSGQAGQAHAARIQDLKRRVPSGR